MLEIIKNHIKIEENEPQENEKDFKKGLQPDLCSLLEHVEVVEKA